MLNNEYVVANIGVDTAECELSKVQRFGYMSLGSGREAGGQRWYRRGRASDPRAAAAAEKGPGRRFPSCPDTFVFTARHPFSFPHLNRAVLGGIDESGQANSFGSLKRRKNPGKY